ncbi:MAG: SPOR domain-containing protein [Nitrospinota bacterium]|nr:SPOR domain-containing protein [Nitrospinota bacterium]
MTKLNFAKLSNTYVAYLAFCSGLLLMASDASAFSLGKIRVTGAYEESFKAEIPVRTDGKAGLFAHIGQEEDYERIDADRPEFLDHFKISVEDHPLHVGQKIIYISCDEPIYQPSFNLLIIARLGGGMIMENYFLALDLQKNVSLSLPTPRKSKQAPMTPEEKEELNKVAEMMRSLRPGQEPLSDEAYASQVTTEKNSSLLDQIRKEEEMEVAKASNMSRPTAPVRQKTPPPQKPSLQPQVALAVPTPYTPPPPIQRAPMRPLEESPVVLAAMNPNESVFVVLGMEAPVEAAPKEEPTAIQTADLAAPVEKASAPSTGGRHKVLAHGIAGSGFDTNQMELERIQIVKVEPRDRQQVELEAMALTEPNPAPPPPAASPVKAPTPAKAAKPTQTASVSRVFSSSGSGHKPATSPTRASVSGGGYRVVRGDNLFKIAAQLGFGSGESLQKAVVALWMENEESFINGNMNGINPGAPLDYSGVRSRMETLTGHQTRRLITDQWRQWKGEKVVASSSMDRPTPRVAMAVEKVAKPTSQIKPRASSSPEKATTNGRETKPKSGASGKPYVVHVASFKSPDHSAEYVRLLRAKGFNAFEIVSQVPGKGVWRRVVVDRMEQMEEAKSLGKTLKKNSISKYTQVLKLPYAISIAGPVEETAARNMLKQYEDKGLAPYALRDQAAGGYNILVGAYPTADNARGDLALLSKLDLQPKIVQP